jgi:phosphoglycolate phosphatase
VIKNILFDLDGTIINSLDGIQSAFDLAHQEIYSTPNQVDIKPFIGPPIGELLTSMNGERDSQRIEAFIDVFKNKYDVTEYKKTILYEGMEELVKTLANKDYRLYIVTNKREKPSCIILKHLDLYDYFRRISCSDSNPETYISKNELVAEVLQDENLLPGETILVGDTRQDEAAAKHNNLQFVFAAYGFGDIKDAPYTIHKPVELLNFLPVK